MVLEEIRSNLRQGEFEAARRLLSKQNPKSVVFRNLQIKVMQEEGRYEDAILAAKTLISNLDRNEIDLRICSLNHLAYATFKLGQMEQSNDYIEEALQLVDSIKGDLEDWSILARTYHLKGLLSRSSGDYEDALVNYFNSLSISRKCNANYLLAKTLNNLGVVYRNLGQMQVAFDYFTRSLDIFTSYSSIHSQAIVQLNLAIINERLGKVTEAGICYEQAYHGQKWLNNDIELSDILYYYSLFLLDNHSETIAFKKFHELWSLDPTKSKLVELRQKVTRAVFLSRQKRVRAVSESIEILEKIIEEPVLDEAISFYSIMMLSNLLIREYQYFRNEDIMEDINWTVLQLDSIAKSRSSTYFTCEVISIKIRIFVILGHYNEAQMLVSHLKQLVEENKYSLLAKKIQEEGLEEKILKLKGEEKEDQELAEIIDYMNVDKSVKDAIQTKSFVQSEIVSEQPIMFLILTEGGMTKSSVRFNTQIILNENLISSFLSAIDSFLNSTFSGTGNVEKVVHPQFNVMFKHRNDLLFCYIYKIETPIVFDKFHRVIDRLYSTPDLREVLSNQVLEPTKKETELIREMIIRELELGYHNMNLLGDQ